MNINEVIKYPILTEKTYAQMPNDVYAFAVDPRTNRVEVKKAIEFIFQVKVKKVNIINIDKKPTKLGKSEGFTNKIKKAIITLKEGKINLYPDEVSKKEKVTPKTKDQKIETKIEVSETEKKVAAKIAASIKNKDVKSNDQKADVLNKEKLKTKDVEVDQLQTKVKKPKQDETTEKTNEKKAA